MHGEGATNRTFGSQYAVETIFISYAAGIHKAYLMFCFYRIPLDRGEEGLLCRPFGA